MPKITDNIRSELTRLLPSSLLTEVACFVFFDNHPRDQKYIDIIVATTNGEIREYFKRDLVNNLQLECQYKPSEIKIIRNGNCDLFYLVIAGDDLTIISRKEKPQIHRRVQNVEKFFIEDTGCRGQASLKVIIKDDAVPLVFDDNFASLGDKAFVLDGLHADDSLPILTELMRKLTQTKYSIKCNEGTLKDFLSLRQAAALASYQRIHPNTEESAFNEGTSKEDDVLRVKSLTPWVKMCNKKIVIALTVSYTNSSIPIEGIHILLHGPNQQSMVYTTKLYVKIKTAPFWKQKITQCLYDNHDVAIVSVVDLEEVTLNCLNRIEFDGVISYKRLGKEHVMPFDKVVLTSMDTMGDGFDALGDINMKDEMLSLAVVATTIKTELLIRHMRAPEDSSVVIPEAFCKYLQMSKIENADRAIIYNKSPYHIMNGLMLVFADERAINDCCTVLVYARSPAQIVALMHCIHDSMPQKIIITTPNIKVSLKSEKQSKNDENATKTQLKVNYDKYATSLLNQSEMLLEYMDGCMAKMGESKDTEIRSKIGSEIDIMATGLPNFIEFRRNMLDEALKGIKSLMIEDNVKTTIPLADSEINMVID